MEITRIVKDNTPVDPMTLPEDGTGTIDHIFSNGSIPSQSFQNVVILKRFLILQGMFDLPCHQK